MENGKHTKKMRSDEVKFLTAIWPSFDLTCFFQNWGVACKRHASGQSETPDGDAFHEQICENEIQVLTCGPIQSYMINIKSARVPRTSFRPLLG